jgi:hypothetical protein
VADHIASKDFAGMTQALAVARPDATGQ